MRLTSEETRVWFEALFGEVPNVPRLAQHLQGLTIGNPGAMMELLRVMLRRGDLRYRDGNWVLPLELGALALPEHAEEAVQRRIAGLGEAARALARALSMHRGALGLALCRALSADLEDAALQAALDELVARGVLALGRQGYGFTHDALRKALEQELAPEPRAALQRRIAHAILARSSRTSRSASRRRGCCSRPATRAAWRC